MSLLSWGAKKIGGSSLKMLFQAALVVFSIGAISNLFNKKADGGEEFVKNSFESGLDLVGDLAEWGSEKLGDHDGPSLS